MRWCNLHVTRVEALGAALKPRRCEPSRAIDEPRRSAKHGRNQLLKATCHFQLAAPPAAPDPSHTNSMHARVGAVNVWLTCSGRKVCNMRIPFNFGCELGVKNRNLVTNKPKKRSMAIVFFEFFPHTTERDQCARF